MDNIIEFDLNKKISGEEELDDLVREMIIDGGMERAILLGMDDEGKINISISGTFKTGEMVMMLEIIKATIVDEAILHVT